MYKYKYKLKHNLTAQFDYLVTTFVTIWTHGLWSKASCKVQSQALFQITTKGGSFVEKISLLSPTFLILGSL